jgi:hypothetical protein
MLNFILGIIFMLNIPDEDCKNLLTHHLDKTHNITNPVKDITYFLEISITYKANPLINGTTDVKMKNRMYLTSEQSIYLSDQMNVYQDNSEIFVVVHSQKKIIRSKSVKTNQEAFTKNLSLVQRGLLDSAASCTCSSKTMNGRQYSVLNVKTKDSFRENTNVVNLVFNFDEEGELASQIVNFTSKADYIFYELVYESLDLDYKQWKPKSLTNYIFDQKGALLPEFNGFTLIDNRQD